jgi:hypothetical protein
MTEFPQSRTNRATRLDDLLGLSPSPQRVDNPLPGSGAVRLDDLLNPPPPPLPPLRQAFETAVARIMQLRGLPPPEAERAAFDIVLVDFLNATHPDTDPNRCAHCGRPETPDATLLPFGWGERHAWLHPGCLNPWRAQRRSKAEDDLARLGVVRPAL